VRGIEDFAVGGAEEHYAGHRRAICIEAWFGTVQDPATSGDPVRMLATAPELPSAGDAVATIDDPCIPGFPQLAYPVGGSGINGIHDGVGLLDFAQIPQCGQNCIRSPKAHTRVPSPRSDKSRIFMALFRFEVYLS
jgi:hypothetical protein